MEVFRTNHRVCAQGLNILNLEAREEGANKQKSVHNTWAARSLGCGMGVFFVHLFFFNIVTELDDVFDKFDEDRDGKITFDDVKSYCLKESVQLFGNNPTDNDIKEYCDKLDKDGKIVTTFP